MNINAKDGIIPSSSPRDSGYSLSAARPFSFSSEDLSLTAFAPVTRTPHPLRPTICNSLWDLDILGRCSAIGWIHSLIGRVHRRQTWDQVETGLLEVQALRPNTQETRDYLVTGHPSMADATRLHSETLGLFTEEFSRAKGESSVRLLGW